MSLGTRPHVRASSTNTLEPTLPARSDASTHVRSVSAVVGSSGHTSASRMPPARFSADSSGCGDQARSGALQQPHARHPFSGATGAAGTGAAHGVPRKMMYVDGGVHVMRGVTGVAASSFPRSLFSSFNNEGEEGEEKKAEQTEQSERPLRRASLGSGGGGPAMSEAAAPSSAASRPVQQVQGHLQEQQQSQQAQQSQAQQQQPYSARPPVPVTPATDPPSHVARPASSPPCPPQPAGTSPSMLTSIVTPE